MKSAQRESEMATPLLTQSRLYTPEEVAELLQVEVREVLAYIREKRLLASHLGGAALQAGHDGPHEGEVTNVLEAWASLDYRV